MNVYIKHTGEVFRGSFMNAPKLSPGYWWVNCSTLGASPQKFREVPQPASK
jgi:hypothetical protein